MTENSFLILDNASNHCTLPVRVALEQVTNGRWDYAPPYSYNLKPCERGLSLVVTWIRERASSVTTEQEAIDLIHAGFFEFSTQGPQGHKAWNHWHQFQENHSAYLADFDA